MYKEKIPKEVEEIILKLNKEGFEAYIVGGCVRDLLMCRIPNDWDITTSAKPEEVKKFSLKRMIRVLLMEQLR